MRSAPLAALAAAVLMAVPTACAKTPTGAAPGSPTPGSPAVSSPAASSPAASGQPSGAAPGHATWQKLPAAPVAREPAMTVSVWTGREMIIHGIQFTPDAVPSGVTFAYRPATRTWARLPAGPRPGTLETIDVAVWTGSRMLVLGQTSGSYDPATNTWRAIAQPGMPLGGAVTGWTGRQFLAWGGTCCADTSNGGKSYDPVTDTWRLLPAAPLAARADAEGAWTGGELIVAGGVTRDDKPKTFRDGAAYNPATGKWRALPAMPRALTPGPALWDGKEVLFLSSTSAPGLAYNPAANRWRLLPAMPAPRSQFTAVWTGRQVLVWGGLAGTFPSWQPPAHGEVYTPAASRWTALPASPLRGRADPAAVWTGTQLIIWGGRTPRELTTVSYTDGASYTG